MLCLCAQFMTANTDTLLLQQHLARLTKTTGYRNHENTAALDQVAGYIHEVFALYADSVYDQPYSVDGKTYRNVVCVFGRDQKETVVLGAHYDVCGNQDGADDNASGVAGLLELARQLKGQPLRQRIELVAYSLEEPPYFRTEYMGSYVHAQSLKESGRPVLGMVSLEMIGYFDARKNSQSYPIGALSLIYGNKGDYITLVNKFGKGRFARKFSRRFVGTRALKTKRFNGPRRLEGIDFSDHLNYWHFGFSATMITDTAFYRNKNYHQTTDRVETLDFGRMAKVVDGVFQTIVAW